MSKDFNSGKRLALARKLKGLMQKEIIGQKGFPHVSIKTLSRWEGEEVVTSRIDEVSRFFGVKSWVFLDPNLDEQAFGHIIMNPGLQESYQIFLQRRRSVIGLDLSLPKQPIRLMEQRAFETHLDLLFKEDLIGLGRSLDAGEINAQNKAGWTLLHWAVFKNKKKALKWLVEQGADLDLGDLVGLTALMVAAGRGHGAMLETLIESRAKLDLQDHSGWTALHWAVVNRYPGLIAKLVLAGANPNLLDDKGRSPLGRAVGMNDYDSCLLLVGPKSRLDLSGHERDRYLNLSKSFQDQRIYHLLSGL